MAKIALLFLFSILLVAFVSGQDCPANQVYDDCDTACPNYCHKDPSSEPCTSQCVARCRCADGYVKRTIDSDECVLARECRRVQRCPRNKALYSCGTACPRYCGQPDNVPCPLICLLNVCQCTPSYVLRSENSNDCIHASQCP